jgi:hypothetical protein
MATYKLDVVSNLGKFHASLYAASGEKQPTTTVPSHNNLDTLVSNLNKQFKQKGVSEDQDAIIFRGIAYEDFSRLARDIKMATY